MVSTRYIWNIHLCFGPSVCLLSVVTFFVGLKVIRPAVPILHLNRMITKFTTSNDDPLFVFKLKKMAVTASLPLREFGLSEPAVPRIAMNIVNDKFRGWNTATDATKSS